MKKILVLLVLVLAAAPTAAAHARGSLDPSFGEGGRVVREAPSREALGPAQVKRGADGTTYAFFRGVLMAFGPNGETDTSFGSGGVMQLAERIPLEWGARLEIDSAGRLIIAGSSKVEEGSYQNPVISRRSLMVARILPSGQLDTSFNGSGVLVTDLGLPEATPPPNAPPYVRGGVWLSARTAAVDGADRIVVTGTHATGYEARKMGLSGVYEGFATRINSDGTVDPTYGKDGVTAGFAPQGLQSAAPAPDGSLYLAAPEGSPAHTEIIRLDAAGHLDPGFGRDGSRAAPFDEEIRMVVDGRGRLTISTWVDRPARRELLVTRYRRDGRPARGFGVSGRVRLRFAPETELKAMAGDRRGGLFIATGWVRPEGIQGGAKSGFLLVHVARDGKVDRRFGRVRSGFGADTATLPEAISVDPEGRPLLAGSISSPLLTGRFGLAMARYRAAR